MKVFFSHSSHDKPLVRELRQHLREPIDSWIDEDRLLVGDDVAKSLEETIATGSDFFVLFVDRRSAESEWVKREIEWALATERRLGRTFVIPVVLEESAWKTFEPEELTTRKYLSCLNRTKEAICSLANSLSLQILHLVKRDLDRSRAMEGRDDRLPVLEETDRFLRSLADEIRTVVSLHRESNPLEMKMLQERLRTLKALPQTSAQFQRLLARLQEQSLLAGVYFDDDEVFMKEEEHFSWKVKTFIDPKRRIARHAVSLIRSGDVVALDGGSTTNEIAKQLARRIKLHRLIRLRVVTNSLPAAHELMSVVSEMGLEDNTEIIQLFVAGGRVRPNTLAIVPLESGSDKEVKDLLSTRDGATICFVGTNGICESGFTTRTGVEAQAKAAMLSLSKRKMIVTDASKFGLEQETVFADLDSGIEVITVRDGFEHVLEQYQTLLAARNTKLIYA